MEQQRLLYKPEDDTALECTRIFTKTISLPCRHVLQQQEAAKQPIQLSDIHRHWHVVQAVRVNDQAEYNLIFNLLLGCRIKGRPTTRSGRIYSSHEVVEQQARP